MVADGVLDSLFGALFAVFICVVDWDCSWGSISGDVDGLNVAVADIGACVVRFFVGPFVRLAIADDEKVY